VGVVAMKASFVWVPSDGADLQPNTCHRAHLATEDSESEGSPNLSRLDHRRPDRRQEHGRRHL